MTHAGAHPGVLILVVGPSGSGKDTLINQARQRLHGDPAFCFPRRIITRHTTLGEDHECISETEFLARAECGGFLLNWSAHGLSYGIPGEIVSELEAGRHVIVNVSRAVVGLARQKWARTEVIHIYAAPEVLRERLCARGRESLFEIDSRVMRATDTSYAVTGPCAAVDNGGSIETATGAFMELIRTFSATP